MRYVAWWGTIRINRKHSSTVLSPLPLKCLLGATLLQSYTIRRVVMQGSISKDVFSPWVPSVMKFKISFVFHNSYSIAQNLLSTEIVN